MLQSVQSSPTQRPRLAYRCELEKFHAPEYIDFLSTVTPDNVGVYPQQLAQFSIGDDCPVFDNLYDFVRLYSGASIGALLGG